MEKLSEHETGMMRWRHSLSGHQQGRKQSEHEHETGMMSWRHSLPGEEQGRETI